MRIVLTIVLAISVLVAVARAERAPDSAAGRQIYVSGSGRSGQPITAAVAGSSELPASMLPCVNCHGTGGGGTAEGGVVASNITWLELTKPYRAATPNGRRRPAYNERTLARAIAEGVDSAGNPLHAAMPRYAMTAEDVADLVAYLKVLGSDEVPGVTATSARIGTIVPDDAPAGAEMARVLSAYLADAGEIHGRRVTVAVVPLSRLDAALQNDPPFAFAGGLIAGADARVEAAVEQAGVPLILPVSTRSDASAGNRQRFYLSPGIEEQVYGLLRQSKASRLRVMTRDEEMAAIVERAAARLEIAITASADDAPVVFLDPAASLASVPRTGTSPLLFVGSLLPHDFFEHAAAYGPRIRVALTTTPGDLTAGGLAEFRAFAERHALPATNAAAQLSAYAAAQVLVQALKQSGRALTRDAFRASLESLYEFETGVTPPLTFGRSRRIAVPRVRVATIDPRSGALVPAGSFNVHD